jgi:2-polyprenyl-3-methyl-5-hydroxy-6-metoxy-1,4-benzoquinol methylase
MNFNSLKARQNMKTTKSSQSTGLLSPLLETIRNRKVAEIISNGSNVLDAGCGRAKLLSLLISMGKTDIRYTGIDSTKEYAEYAKKTFPDQKFMVMNVEDINTASLTGKYDFISLVAVIEHLDNPSAVLAALSACLSDRGRILITAPSKYTNILHRTGAKMALLSKEASDEHRDVFPDKTAFEKMAKSCGMNLTTYKKFLFGMNQLAIMEKSRA